VLVSLTTCGTRGDTQPMVVLGSELRRRGHEVRIAASPNTLDIPRRCGFEALPLGPDSQQLMESPAGQRWLAAGNVGKFMKELSAISRQSYTRSVEETRAACASADVIVSGILSEDLTAVFAEAADIPLATLHHAPYRPNRAYPNPMVASRKLPPRMNQATGLLFDRVFWRGTRDEVEPLRAQLGLPEAKISLARRRTAPTDLELQAYDELLVPGLEWDARRARIGFLALDQPLREALSESGLDPELTAWLEAGEPPVFFGFGSMPVQDPAAVVTLITEVSRALGVRALISAGWGRLSALEPDGHDVTVVGAVDHDAVLTRCVAAVHHGGAGTLATSLGAGIPTVVCSVFADQPFWGQRVVDQGVGAHLRFAKLSRTTLERALREALVPQVRDRARVLGGALQSGQSAAVRAADAIEAIT